MIKTAKTLISATVIILFVSCSESNNTVIDDIPDSITVEEQLTNRWMPVRTVLNDMVLYERSTSNGMENDTHNERILYKDDQTVRISANDGSIHLFTWELSSLKDSVIIAKGMANERRYFIDRISGDSLSYSIEPASGHKVTYSFVKEHDEATNRSDLISKDWKYDLVWARLYSMDGFKYIRNGSIPNALYENAKVSFNNDGTFRISSGNTIHEQGLWHLDLDDMLLVIEGNYKREATLLELNENKMIFLFKNPQDNDIKYQIDFSRY
ncbi:hypothetical protein MQE36_08265 [Zhouia spongiae]|uniref:Lipocalin-like domain-containing protein n=1 Tax=Zhouia spongiae TaxID=2202721 RepID=A0ABY3YRK1_9FLAO|nr:hypothetical protein [Zhouia spongiae]UNZ00319.1 hypothetical protein MQE36_08265 [Zhouia spongiae]